MRLLTMMKAIMMAGWHWVGRVFQAGIETEPLAYIQPASRPTRGIPSYVWHETLPFEGYGDRMVIAFDLVPSDES